MEHINRDGHRYFAFQGKTKKGLPKFFASRQEASEKGVRIEELPAGYEFYEAPKRGRVFIRKRRTCDITVAEQNRLRRLALEYTTARFAVVVEKKQLLLYSPPKPVWNERTQEEMQKVFPRDWGTIAFLPYFRYTLVDKEQRLFTIEICDHRNYSETWYQLTSDPTSLDASAMQYLPHIQKATYFDLFQKGHAE